MKTALAVTRKLLALAGLLMLPGESLAQTTIPSAPPLVSPDAPPAEIWQRGSPTVRYGSALYRDVHCRVLDKVVSLEWRYSTPQTPGIDNVKDLNSEVFATRFWPTYALPIDNYRICVAGKARTGETVLELWRFASQSSSGTPAPSVVPNYPQGGGPPQYMWTVPPRTSAEVLLNSPATDPRGLIRAIFPDLSSPNRVLVYYDGSREVYSLDVNLKSETLVASPSGTASVLHEAALTNGYHRFWAADYSTKGYCYLLIPEYAQPSAALPNILVLIDSDRDGDMDDAQLLDGSAWSSGGWGDPANIVSPVW